MTWYAWTIVAAVLVSSLLVVRDVDKPRKPMTRGSAVVILIVNALFVWAIFALAGHS